MKLKISLLVLLIVLLTGGCRTAPDEATEKKVSQPITVQTIECSDPVLGKMMTLCIMERLARLTPSVTTQSEENQTGIVIKGIVHQKEVSAAGSNSTAGISLNTSAGFGASQTTTNAFSGSIVEGVSLLVFLDGKEIGTATYFQTPKKGSYQSPQLLIEIVTDRIYANLVQRGLILRR